jgi:hypothetical protein
MSAIGPKQTWLVHRTCPLSGVKRTWSALRCGYDPLVQFSPPPMAAQAAEDSKSRGLPTQKEFLRCVTTASKTSGHDLRRLATSSLHETSEQSHAVSLEDPRVAVCVLPGTELAFANAVAVARPRFIGWKVEKLGHMTAIFRQVNKNEPMQHHDALEFPDGRIVLLTTLSEGQEATVLQLPAQPTTAVEADAQKRVAHVG